MEFTKRTLGDICDEVRGIVQTGPFGSQLHKSDYKDEGIPVVMPKNIIDDKISIEEIARIGKEDVERLSQHKLQKDDIVYGRRGDIGRRALAREEQTGWLCGTGCIKISLRNASILEPSFLYYYLGQPEIVSWIYNQAIGVTMPNLNTSIIRSIPITYPPLTAQKKIASILSSYDDLIENNTRRIEILEQMAKLVYEEWFIKFRFPGHENVKMVPSDLGEIPERWELKKLEEIANINELSIKNGGAPQEINYIDISSVTTGKIDEIKSIAFADAPSRARRIVKHGDIIWSTVRPNRKSFAMILNPLPNLIASTGFAVITAKKIPYTYLYHALTTDDFVGYLTNNATGAAYPAVNTNDFKNANILVPNDAYLNQFHNIVSNIFNLKQNLLDKNQNLRKTRDLLLPKLISGEIDVSDLDIRIRNEFREP